MNNVWVLLKNNLYVMVVKKKTTFLIGLIAPLIILFVMGKILNFGGGSLNLGIIDNDKSNTSNAIVDFVKEGSVFNIVNVSEEEAEGKFQEKAIDGLIEIPQGFEDSMLSGEHDKLIITGKENDGIDEMISNMLYSEVNNLNTLAQTSENNKDVYYQLLDNYTNDGEIKVYKEPLSDLKGDYQLANMFIGFIMFFMLIRGVTGSEHYYDEKRENVFNRFFMAPVKSYEYYLADLLSNYVVVILQALVGVIGIKILGTNTGVTSLELFVIMAMMGLVSVALAICIRAFSKTSGEFNMVFNFTIMVMIMVGGCFVPIDFMPKLVNNISYFTPTRWVMECMSDLQLGLGFQKIIPYLFIILLFAVVFFVIGAYKTAKSEKEFTVS